jgi:tetratricopeptide (TPR) repeat protein
MKWIRRFLLLVIALSVLAGLAMLIPDIRDRVVYHVDQWRIQVEYALNPPEKEVFVPQQEEVNQIVQATLAAIAQAKQTPMPSATPTATLAPEQPSPTPQPTLAPPPASASLQGVKYIDQHGLWNYCAPANLAMELSYWGWEGDRTDIGKVVKPFEKDKNVMPYELADYVRENTDLGVVQRSGGTLELIKRLVSSGFPVLIEKGAFLDDLSGKISWMGHYTVITGYDDTKEQFITQDSFFNADYPVAYAELESGWRAFNYVFLVVYSADKESQLMTLLGPLADEQNAYKIASETAANEIYKTEGNDQFFAWYNRGTSLVNLGDYVGAAQAYDQAFQVYATLVEKKRPWRMLWYQTGPYFAYYYSGRYQDVVNLASQTIDAASEPFIEESFYWRAMAEAALGQQNQAVEDLKTSLQYHPGFSPSMAEMNTLGVAP